MTSGNKNSTSSKRSATPRAAIASAGPQALSADRYFSPIERLSADKVRDIQLQLLRRQLECLKRNRFFGPKLAELDVSSIRSINDFRQSVPVTRKADLIADQNTMPPFGTRLGVDRDDVRSPRWPARTLALRRNARFRRKRRKNFSARWMRF